MQQHEVDFTPSDRIQPDRTQRYPRRVRARVLRSALVLGVAGATAACTLVYSKDGYVGGGPAAGDAGDAATPDDGGCAFTAPVYEVKNASESTSLFTVDAAEVDRFADAGFTDRRGVVFRVAKTSGAGRAPIYRIHNPTTDDRLWTASATEVANTKATYSDDEGIAFYAAASQARCLVPVYGLERLGRHTLAASDQERAALVDAGWSVEVPRFYAAPP